MKILAFLLVCFLATTPIFSQQHQFIEVTGNAQKFIEPDEIVFNIGIAEYWENEFNERPNQGNKGKKINILDIEKQLLSELKRIGVPLKNITSTDVGNSWRRRNEALRMRKAFEISLKDFSLINRIISEVNNLGVEYMRIGELKHENIETHKIEIRKKALLSAKKKANYLVETLGKKVGDVISISEVNSNNYYSNSPMRAMAETSSTGLEVEKKINLYYKITAKFEIVD